MYPALDEELEDEQCLPLTGVHCAEIDEALRSLAVSTKKTSAKTFEETRKLLNQVCCGVTCIVLDRLQLTGTKRLAVELATCVVSDDIPNS